LPANNPFSDAIAAVTQEYEHLSEDADKKKTPPMRGRRQVEIQQPSLSEQMKGIGISPPSRDKLRAIRQLYVS